MGFISIVLTTLLDNSTNTHYYLIFVFLFSSKDFFVCIPCFY